MKLARRSPDRPLISLVPMIDVMLILLVFFMVTSTYLNLDMIPFVQRSGDVQAPAPTAPPETGGATTLLVRLGAGGQPFVRGKAQNGPELSALAKARLAENPLLAVTVLPSPQARTQDLVTVMDLLTRAGVTRLRLMRVQARE